MIINHTEESALRGLLAIIPLALSFIAMGFLYSTIEKRMMKIVDEIFGFTFPGLGIVFPLAFLYILGLVTSKVVGKQVIDLIQKITDPTYQENP